MRNLTWLYVLRSGQERLLTTEENLVAFDTVTSIFQIHHPGTSVDDARYQVVEWLDNNDEI